MLRLSRQRNVAAVSWLVSPVRTETFENKKYYTLGITVWQNHIQRLVITQFGRIYTRMKSSHLRAKQMRSNMDIH